MCGIRLIAWQAFSQTLKTGGPEGMHVFLYKILGEFSLYFFDKNGNPMAKPYSMADVVTSSQLVYQKLHKALLQTIIKFCLISPAGISSQNNLLNVSLPGVEFREGGQQWLTDNVMLAKVRMIPLQITANNTLDCILYKRQVNISSQTSMCVHLS